MYDQIQDLFQFSGDFTEEEIQEIIKSNRIAEEPPEAQTII